MERKENTGQSRRREPLRFFRVRCGRKVWSPWLDDEAEAWWRAHHLGLGRYDHKRRRFFAGPLMWIEVGERAYAGRRTIPLRVDRQGRPLPPLNQPTMRLEC